MVLPYMPVQAEDDVPEGCLKPHKFTWEEIEAFASSDPVTSVIQSEAFKAGKPPELPNAAKELVWEFLTTPELGPMGGGVTLMNLSGLPVGSLDTGLTHLGGILAIAQLYIDIRDGNPQYQVNFAKSTSFWAIGTFKVFCNAIKTTAVGIALIDYSLNKLAAETSKMRYEFWEEAYRRYYDKKFGHHVSDMSDWENLFFKQYKGDVDAALKKEFMKFWDDAEVNATSVGMNATKGMVTIVRNLPQDQKDAIRQDYLAQTLPTIRNNFEVQRKKAIRKLVNEFQYQYDKLREQLAKQLIFTGRVTDSTGQPLPGTEVRMYDREPVTTDSDGQYAIRLRTCELYMAMQKDGREEVPITAAYTSENEDSARMASGRFPVRIIWGEPNRDQGPFDLEIKLKQLQQLEIDKQQVEVKQGEATPLKITAVFDDNSREEVTDSVDWDLSDTTVLKAQAGAITAVGKGTAKASAVYTHRGKTYTSPPCVFTVKPSRTLTEIKISPQRLDLQPGDTAQLSAKAIFSDGTEKDITTDPDCSWKPSNPLLGRLDNGKVVVKNAQPGKPKHSIMVTYVADGVVKRQTVPVTVGYPKRYLSLKLSESTVSLQLNDSATLTATALVGRGPVVLSEDVTQEADWQSDNPNLVSVQPKGVLKSAGKPGQCAVDVSLTVPGRKLPLRTACSVSVVDTSSPPAVLDFTVAPGKGPYRVGDTLTFQSVIEQADPADYDITWYLDKKELYGSSIRYRFDEAGVYAVRMLARHKVTGVEDAIPRNVTIVEQQRAMGCDLVPSPEQKRYTAPVTIQFNFKCESYPPGLLTWSLDRKLIKQSMDRSYQHTFTKPGHYVMACGFTFTNANGSVGNSIHNRDIYVDADESEKATPDARWKNKFKAERDGDEMHISYSYYDLKKQAWSPWRQFRTFGGFGDFAITTGAQADGINTGWIVYTDKKRRNLRFHVLGFNFSGLHVTEPYKGVLDMHGKTMAPGTLEFKKTGIRMAMLEWRCTDGSICRAKISKYPPGGSVQGGAVGIGCVEGDGSNPCSKDQIWSVFPTMEELGLKGGEEKRETEKLSGNKYFTFKWYGKREFAPPANHQGLFYKSVSLDLHIHKSPAAAQEEIAGLVRLYSNADPRPYGDEAVALAYGNTANYMTAIRVGKIVVLVKTRDYTKPPGQRYPELDKTILQEMMQAIRNLPCEPTMEMEKSVSGLKILTYKSGEWPVRVTDGKLEVAADKSSSGAWKPGSWKTVATRITDYVGTGTGQGPVIAYQKDDRWTIVRVNWLSGFIEDKRSIDHKPVSMRGGPYGAVVTMQDGAYDYSFGKFKKQK
jgi:plastocyanin/uncharacterized protein YjdB